VTRFVSQSVGASGLFILIGAAGLLQGLAQPGALDPSFTPGQGLTQPASGAHVAVAKIQPDGRILLAGSFSQFDGVPRPYLVRLQTNGLLDPEFDGHLSGAVLGVLALGLQPDGKTLVGGDFIYVGGLSHPYLVRLHADGSKDSGFAWVPLQSRVRAIECQPDGRIIIAGDFGALNGAGRNIARLTTNGVPDNSFTAVVGPAGGGSGTDPVTGLARQADGRLLISGDFQLVNGQPRVRVARLFSDGSLDESFSPGAGPNGWVYRMLVQPDGKIVIAGLFNTVGTTPRPGIARLLPNGSLDASFGSNLEPTNAVIYALARQPDGKLLVGGAFSGVDGHPVPGLARLSADGSLDGSFLADAAIRSASAMALQPDGRIVVGGFSLPSAFQSTGGIYRVLGGPYEFRFIALRPLPDGHVALDTIGEPDRRFVLEATADLVRWRILGTNDAPTVCHSLVDESSPAAPFRFYRGYLLSSP